MRAPWRRLICAGAARLRFQVVTALRPTPRDAPGPHFYRRRTCDHDGAQPKFAARLLRRSYNALQVGIVAPLTGPHRRFPRLSRYRA